MSSFSSTAQGIQAILGANRKKMLWKWAKWWKMFGNGGNGRNGGTSMQWTPIRHLLSLAERAALQRTAESIRVLNRIQILNASLFNNEQKCIYVQWASLENVALRWTEIHHDALEEIHHQMHRNTEIHLAVPSNFERVCSKTQSGAELFTLRAEFPFKKSSDRRRCTKLSQKLTSLVNFPPFLSAC